MLHVPYEYNHSNEEKFITIGTVKLVRTTTTCKQRPA
jgi:hypothetical protein